MRYFYGVHLGDERFRRLFNLARLILEPDFARACHITLRGPYERKPPKNSKWFKYELDSVEFTKPDVFFNEFQNTVYLRSVIIGANDIWWKRDYKQGVPHFSLYDGNDRNFAWQILMKLREFPWKLTLKLSEVSVIEKKHNYSENFLLKIDEIDKAFDEISERALSTEYIKDMKAGQRIFFLDKICSAIHLLNHPSSTQI